MQNKINRSRKPMVTFVLIAVVVFGCLQPVFSSPHSKRVRQVSTAQPFDLKQGQTVSVKGTKLEIKVLEIQDSRCPRNVTCVWAGNGAVKLSVSLHGRNRQVLTLNTMNAQKFLSEQNYGGYKLALQTLNPYPGDGQSGDKVATLIVTKLRR
ncbi:MAG TPA: hypothetical protein VLL54_18715 [Pyrinomonadaceae bacterium]|nr:hypothetical protein [Pyrinomonadaceae bacterium]